MIATSVMNSPVPFPERRAGVHEQDQANHSASRAIRVQMKLEDQISQAIETWLLDRYASPHGESTAAIYSKILITLRTYLRAQGLDLNSPAGQLTQQIQTWANLRTSASKRQGNVAPSTYNQRIAAINNFYSWASHQGVYRDANPVEQLGRNSIRKYADASALDIGYVRHQLKEIDQSTPRGQRDYVLLQVALNTGRSASELANLTWGSLAFQKEHVILTFAGGRGGKVMSDMLDQRLSQALLAYLSTIYGDDLSELSPQFPIWISFSDRTYRQAIGKQTIADICETHLGVSRIHKLRHTFAFTMDQLGASVGTIQARLGHESQSTTSTYLASLKKAYNPYAVVLADAFGV